MNMWKIRIAWLVAVVAMFGSLYFSEIRHFVPCELCWYQRILMYSSALMLTVALIRNEKVIRPYILVMSVIGIFVSAFHYLKQHIPALDKMTPCTQGVPCSVHYVDWFGFITIPLLAFTAFVLITIVLTVDWKKEKNEKNHE